MVPSLRSCLIFIVLQRNCRVIDDKHFDYDIWFNIHSDSLNIRLWQKVLIMCHKIYQETLNFKAKFSVFQYKGIVQAVMFLSIKYGILKFFMSPKDSDRQESWLNLPNFPPSSQKHTYRTSMVILKYENNILWLSLPLCGAP